VGVNEGVNILPRGQISPLGARGEVKNGFVTRVQEDRGDHGAAADD
jgi:hypothetical protein